MRTQTVFRTMLAWHWRKARRLFHSLGAFLAYRPEPQRQRRATGVRWG